MIQISQAAAKEIKRIQTSRQQPDSFLRLRVQSGGCAGLFYVLELESFADQNHSCEHTCESNGVSLVLDKQTAAYIQGLKLDYSEDLMGGGFRFQNPNAFTTCSCGLSFAVNSVSES